MHFSVRKFGFFFHYFFVSFLSFLSFVRLRCSSLATFCSLVLLLLLLLPNNKYRIDIDLSLFLFTLLFLSLFLSISLFRSFFSFLFIVLCQQRHGLLAGVCFVLSTTLGATVPNTIDPTKRDNLESAKDKRQTPLGSASSAGDYENTRLYGGIPSPAYSTYGPPQAINRDEYDGLATGRLNGNLNGVRGFGVGRDGFNTFDNHLDVLGDNAGFDNNYPNSQQLLGAGSFGVPIRGVFDQGDFGYQPHSARFGQTFGNVLGGVGSTNSFDASPLSFNGNAFAQQSNAFAHAQQPNGFAHAQQPNQNQPIYAAGSKGLGHYAGVNPDIGSYGGNFEGLRYNAPITNSRPIALTSASLAPRNYPSNGGKGGFRPSAFLGSTLLSSTPDYQYAQSGGAASLTSLGAGNRFHVPDQPFLPSNEYQPSHSSISPAFFSSSTGGSSSSIGSSTFESSIHGLNGNFGPTAPYAQQSSAGFGLPFNGYRSSPSSLPFAHNQLNARPTFPTNYVK